MWQQGRPATLANPWQLLTMNGRELLMRHRFAPPGIRWWFSFPIDR